MDREVVIIRQQAAPSFLGLFFLIFAIYIAWKWIVAGIAIAIVGFLTWWIVKTIRADLVRQAEIAEGFRQRATEQDAQFCKGDPRGTYGEVGDA